MYIQDIVCITLYEVKQKSRRWEFRLFVFFALVGITLCHVYWHYHSTNWEASALCCSVPLMNAYLFSVLQSLFLIPIITDFSRSEKPRGEEVCVFTRPLSNMTYTWGKIFGNLILFGLVNVLVILSCLLFVHIGSIAPYKFGYYLFYSFTITFPSFVFISGLSLWLTRWIRWQFLVIVILSIVWIASVIWLPYCWHGTFDFLASGIPNLFSDVTGHVGMNHYLLHRATYFVLGLGLLLLSVRPMNRIPNHPTRIKKYSLLGYFFIFISFLGMFMMEYSFLPAREARSAYRDCFHRYWSEIHPQVSSHDITFQSNGDSISIHSKLTLTNTNQKDVSRIVLFLNPGLHVRSILSDNEEIQFQREGQIIAIERSLMRGDSLHLEILYSGRIDERVTDLHLRDSAYEDSFRGNRFFPTGRRCAFVSDNFLILTPACIWYPVSVPPVNPEIPAFTRRDFTRFRLTVVGAAQKVLCSQGKPVRRKDTCVFQPSQPLAGISLCGGDYVVDKQSIPDLNMYFYTFKSRGNPLREVGRVPVNTIHSILAQRVYPTKTYKWANMDWYEEDRQTLYFMEVPLPFITEAWIGKSLTGMVEPGMVFLTEKGFGIITSGFKNEVSKDLKAEYVVANLLHCFNSPFILSYDNHPLTGIVRSSRVTRYLNPYRAFSLLEYSGCFIQSEKYPFINYLLDRIILHQGSYSEITAYVQIDGVHESNRMYYKNLANNSLSTLFRDKKIKQDILYGSYLMKELEFLNRLTSEIQLDTLLSTLADVSRSYRGWVDQDTFTSELDLRLGKKLLLQEKLQEWLHTEHRQFFIIKDLREKHYPGGTVPMRGGYLAPTEWVEYTGKVMNAGQTGGTVAIDLMGLMGYENIKEYHTCYLKPGEAKAFYLLRETMKDFSHVRLYTGLSSNNPRMFDFEVIRGDKEIDVTTPVECTWKDIDPSELSVPENVTIVDDVDPGFSFNDAGRTWLQKWFEKPLEPRGFLGPIPTRWTPSIDIFYYGDSIRSCYFKGFGKGDFTATWKTELKTAGRYRISARASKRYIDPRMEIPKGVIYHYTIKSDKEEIKKGVELDRFIHYRQWEGWICLGVFDFPAGEVSVTLSDYDELGRDFIAVIADAVKWEKLED